MSTRKLVSSKGTLLGVVTFPDRFSERLEKGDAVEFYAPPEMGNWWKFDPGEPVIIRYGFLIRSYAMRDAVMLGGMLIEEFEKLDGFWFSPSAAYLRSLLD